MAKPLDPVQRHIVAVLKRDSIVPADASDLLIHADASPKMLQRQLLAMLPGVDYPADGSLALTDDPVGRRVGRVAFNPCIERYWSGNVWTGSGPQPHRLPASQSEISRFHRQQAHLYETDPESGAKDDQFENLIGFSINDHARVSEILQKGGETAHILIANFKLAAACADFEKQKRRTNQTGRNMELHETAAFAVEVALNGASAVTAEVALTSQFPPFGVHAIASELAHAVEFLRRTRSQTKKRFVSAVRRAALTAASAQRWLTTGKLDRNKIQYDRDVRLLPKRLLPRAIALAAEVERFVHDVVAIDTMHVFRLLMARRLDVAIRGYPWLKAPHPSFRVCYSYIGGHAIFAELERVGLIARNMVERQNFADGSALSNRTIRESLAGPEATSVALVLQNVAGRYLDLGVYHSSVTKAFMLDNRQWMSRTIPQYTHHAYATGTRLCNLHAAAADSATHALIRASELNKPTQAALREQALVLFYGLPITDMVILALRQITDRVCFPKSTVEQWRVAFGRTVHLILSQVAPAMAREIAFSSCLLTNQATCKGLANRATSLANRFNDHDYDRPFGAFFDYTRWFDRDRDLHFWNRLQRSPKLYAAFGSSYIPALYCTEREKLPMRQGRSPTAAGQRSKWAKIMLEARRAFVTYAPLYVKTRPRILTARVMTRLSEGYSSLASDPQFWRVFRFQ